MTHLNSEEELNKIRFVIGMYLIDGEPDPIKSEDKTEKLMQRIKSYADERAKRAEAIESYLVASDILLDLGPLKIQASQARDNFPPQTHECIENAYNKIKKILDDNGKYMKGEMPGKLFTQAEVDERAQLIEAELKFYKERARLNDNKYKKLAKSIDERVREARVDELNRVPFTAANDSYHRSRHAQLTQQREEK